jgi:signal transduction histidine kinase
MGRTKAAFCLPLLAGLFILGLSVFGFIGQLTRPGIPRGLLAIAGDGERLASERDLLPRAVVRADGFEIRDHQLDFKFIAARHRIGDPVEFVVAQGGGERTVTEPLAAYYDRGLPFVFLATGVLGFLLGFMVFILRRDDRRARLFFWLCLAFSAAVTISGEWYGVQGRPLHLVPGVLFFLAYAMTPVLLLRFVVSFTPRDRLWGEPWLWAAALLFGLLSSVITVAALLVPSIEIFRLKAYFALFRIFFGACVLAAIVILFRAFKASPSRERRDQVRWVLYGIIVGLGPFVLFYTAPLVLGLRPLLSEETASALFAVLPLAFGFAILKYRLLDVRLIINRGVVYSLMTMVTVAVYLVSVEGLKALFSAAAGTRPWIPLGAVFIAALAFAPARSWVQVLVDRAFFRRSYDFRRAVGAFRAQAAKAHSAPDLVARLSAQLDETLPVERLGVFIPNAGPGGAAAAYLSGLDDEAAARLKALPAGAEAPMPPDELARLGFVRALSVALDGAAAPGWIFVGPARSGLALSEPDLELVRALVAETAASLERIRLQEEVIYERASREKLEEMGRLKTEFIASVSHELRTPMTSLQAISELLKSGKVADPSRRDQLLDLMAGECGRLGRYLHNVLDFGRIEQDAKRYEIRPVDLGPIVAEVAEIARSAAAREGDLDLTVDVPAGPVTVEADPDAVRQALLNLVDNAVKYSRGEKYVGLRLAASGDGGAEISVSDHGIGIAPEDRERVFEAFFRTPEAVRHDAKGVGLGLRIVKHVMDGHGGAIAVSGAPGRGTTFTLRFPGKAVTHEEDPDHR